MGPNLVLVNILKDFKKLMPYHPQLIQVNPELNSNINS